MKQDITDVIITENRPPMKRHEVKQPVASSMYVMCLYNENICSWGGQQLPIVHFITIPTTIMR